MDKMVKVLIGFLKENGAYSSFVKECKKFGNKTMEEMFDHINCHEFIMCAFNWSESENGPEYWEDLDARWNEICDNTK